MCSCICYVDGKKGLQRESRPCGCRSTAGAQTRPPYAQLSYFPMRPWMNRSHRTDRRPLKYNVTCLTRKSPFLGKKSQRSDQKKPLFRASGPRKMASFRRIPGRTSPVVFQRPPIGLRHRVGHGQWPNVEGCGGMWRLELTPMPARRR